MVTVPTMVTVLTMAVLIPAMVAGILKMAAASLPVRVWWMEIISPVSHVMYMPHVVMV